MRHVQQTFKKQSVPINTQNSSTKTSLMASGARNGESCSCCLEHSWVLLPSVEGAQGQSQAIPGDGIQRHPLHVWGAQTSVHSKLVQKTENMIYLHRQ